MVHGGGRHGARGGGRHGSGGSGGGGGGRGRNRGVGGGGGNGASFTYVDNRTSTTTVNPPAHHGRDRRPRRFRRFPWRERIVVVHDDGQTRPPRFWMRRWTHTAEDRSGHVHMEPLLPRAHPHPPTPTPTPTPPTPPRRTSTTSGPCRGNICCGACCCCCCCCFRRRFRLCCVHRSISKQSCIVRSIVPLFVLLVLLGMSGKRSDETWSMHPGESRLVVVPGGSTLIRAVEFRLLDDGSSGGNGSDGSGSSSDSDKKGITVYRKRGACPPLTGRSVRLRDTRQATLSPGDYEYDKYHLNAGSRIDALLTPVRGGTDLLLLRGKADFARWADDPIESADSALIKVYSSSKDLPARIGYVAPPSPLSFSIWSSSASSSSTSSYSSPDGDEYYVAYDNALGRTAVVAVDVNVTLTAHDLSKMRPIPSSYCSSPSKGGEGKGGVKSCELPFAFSESAGCVVVVANDDDDDDDDNDDNDDHDQLKNEIDVADYSSDGTRNGKSNDKRTNVGKDWRRTTSAPRRVTTIRVRTSRRWSFILTLCSLSLVAVQCVCGSGGRPFGYENGDGNDDDDDGDNHGGRYRIIHNENENDDDDDDDDNDHDDLPMPPPIVPGTVVPSAPVASGAEDVFVVQDGEDNCQQQQQCRLSDIPVAIPCPNKV